MASNIDKAKLSRIANKIITLEKENKALGLEKTNEEMQRKIVELIERVVRENIK